MCRRINVCMLRLKGNSDASNKSIDTVNKYRFFESELGTNMTRVNETTNKAALI